MAHAHRVAISAYVFILIYLLTLLGVLPIPLPESEAVVQLLPVVRTSSRSN